MFFKGRLDKILDVKKAESDFKKTLEETPLEKNDTPAMILAALLVFVPAILITVGVFLTVIWFFFLR